MSSFQVSKVKFSPFIRKESNEIVTEQSFLYIPTEKHISELPLPNNLRITPYFGPSFEKQFFDAMINFDVRADDVFVCSLPKCGSSWMQTIAWFLTHNLDYGTIQSADRTDLMPDFDRIFTHSCAAKKTYDLLLNSDRKESNESIIKQMVWNECYNFESPRVIKTHLPVYFLPKCIWEKKAKVLYVARNAKDMAVSMYHFCRNFFQDTQLKLDDVVDGITNDNWIFSSQFNHCLNFWNCRHLPNILFVAYEDLVTDSFANIKKISEFLSCNYSDEQLQKLTEYVSFEKMRNNKSINREDDVKMMENQLRKERPDSEFRFLRKGTPGAYRDELSDTQIKKFDDWIRKNQVGTDFRYKMD